MSLLVIWGIVLEFPIRYFLSPDPWVHSADHWYFVQPNRLLLELGFVFLAILPFFYVFELKRLLSFKWTKDNWLYFTIGLMVTVFIFVLQQWAEIEIIQINSLHQYVLIWFLSGMIIGIGQELTFRGLIFTGVTKCLNQKWGITLSTLLFVLGAIHSVRMFAYIMKDYMSVVLILLVIYTLTGLLFVWLRIKTNNIIIPALIHGVGNAITWSTFVVVKLYS